MVVGVFLVGEVGVLYFVEGEFLCGVDSVEFDANVETKDAVFGVGVEK